MYMRIKSSNKIKLDSILSTQNVKCKVTKGRQILSGHPNLTYATTLLVPGTYTALCIWRRRLETLEEQLRKKTLTLKNMKLEIGSIKTKNIVNYR